MEQRKSDKIQTAPEAHPSRFVLKKFAYAATEYSMRDILYRGRFTDVFKVAGLVTKRERALKVTDGDGQGSHSTASDRDPAINELKVLKLIPKHPLHPNSNPNPN